MSRHSIRHRRIRSVLAIAAASTMLVLTGCSGGTTSSATDPSDASAESATPRTGGSIVWGIETKITSANPQRNGQDKARAILRNAYDSLVYRNSEGSYDPWLAESWDTSDDGLTYTFHLREGVTYSDGAAFDAASLVANFDKLTTDGYLSSTPQGLKFLDNYEATGEYDFTVTLTEPDNLFLLYLSTPNGAPLSPDTLTLPQDELEVGGPEVAGVGPFVVSAFDTNTGITFTRRDDYAWAPDAIANGQTAAYLESVEYRTFAEGSTRTGALEQGQIQVSSDIQPLDVPIFEDSDAYRYYREHVAGTPYTLYFNVSQEPFDDQRVREAFVKGADYDAIIQSIYQGAFDRAWAPISTVGPFADLSLEGWAQPDIDAANRLLDEAGWTERNADGVRTKDGKTLTVRAVSGTQFVRESRDQLNLAIGAALKQNVGINYEFQMVDSGTESERADANDYEIFDNSYGTADPAAGLDLLYYSSDPTRGTIARGRFNDSELEALIDQGRFSTDLNERKTAYTEIQNLVTTEKYYALPLYQTQDNIATLPTVHGITFDPAVGQPFGAYKVWIEQ